MTEQQAVDALIDACFAQLEAGRGSESFPDPAAFLERRAVAPSAHEITVGHMVTDGGAAPQKALCPDGSDGCTYVRRKLNGKEHWVWVCRCPGPS